MTSDDVRKALRRLRAIAQRRERLAEDESDAIEQALRLDVQQLDVAAAVKRSREHVRRVAEARGVPSRYPARRSRTPEQPTD